MNKRSITPDVSVLIKRQQDQCPGGIEIGILK